MASYTTPPAFTDLYYDFTGYAHPGYPSDRVAIAENLSKAIADSSANTLPGPLVVATSTGIYVYDAADGHALISGTDVRCEPNSGFYELTSLSHVGPAIAYLATIKEMGGDQWKSHIPEMIDHLHGIKTANAVPMKEHWATQLAERSWVGKEAMIKKLVDYTCSLAGNYLVNVRDGKEELSAESVVSNLLEVNTSDYPISFNTIMIGTFSLIALKSAYDIYSALSDKRIDWENAKVLLHNAPGTNYGAGLTPESNWVHPTIKAIAGADFDKERIIIAPYATIPEAVSKDALSDVDFDFLSDNIWAALYAGPQITEKVFTNIKDISIPERNAIPGDYSCTKAGDIDDFIMRLKFSTGNIGEMLSNTVGFWIAGEAVAKSWDLSSMDLPGFTHGLPKGMSGYPDASPDIKES
ncbi:MAG: hypothetical protein COB66_02580 [Coxiella sp. (in: Bacteria)]|nr:MAG: hypothetical protein COB66_02580 [Coxiella sp. (in: g-proteobacteria)]